MAEKRKGLMAWLAPWLLMFAAGAATGYYMRDRQQHEKVLEAADKAREEMETAGLEAIERARRAGSDFRAGADAAAESTKAAFRELVGSAPREP